MESSPSKKKDYWTANEAMEQLKLSSAESGWNLPGSSPKETRTRYGGTGRPNLDEATRRLQFHFESDTDSSYSLNEGSDSALSSYVGEDDEDEFMVDAEEEKPSTKRAILEVAPIAKIFSEHSKCPLCGKKLDLQFESVCLATSVTVTCSTRGCGYVAHGDPPAKANIQVRNFPFDSRERNTDYAINIIYALGIISVGDGSVEAGRLCGLLSLPRDTSMERRSFPIIEERIGPAMRDLQDEILQANLVEEVYLTNMKSGNLDENDFMLWKQSLDPHERNDFVLNKRKYPVLQVSFDMAWQQKGSGHVYNSASGHAIFVGKETRKAIALDYKSKRCNFCLQFWKTNPVGPVEKHQCWQNYVGSSGAMEPQACLDILTRLYDKKNVIISMICCDDDASTRSLLKWSNADFMKNNNTTKVPMVPITKGKNAGKLQPRPDKGSLAGHIPEPSFVADPNHRRKILTGELYKVFQAKAKERMSMTRMDINRIGKNFGYMMKSLRTMEDESQYEAAGRAILEHHYDNHEYCGAWCKRKMMSNEQRAASKRYYRRKDDPVDAKLYVKLKRIVDRFITLERLREVAHGMDTNVNESFNNTVSWFAPKNRVFCGTGSLANRLAMAVGINSVGFLAYFTRLYAKLGITMDSSVIYFLKQKDALRSKRLESMKKAESKKRRLEKKYAQLKDDEMQARVQRKKRAGTYRRGINLDDDDDDKNQQERRNAKKKSKRDIVCSHCGRQGHSTTRSKHCLKNPNHDTSSTREQPAADVEMRDDGPQDNDDTSSAASEMFFDVGTWSDDDEDADYTDPTVAFI